jgi:NAD-dependent dihydropyrimidine dehydrogenase PreA subunit
LCERRLDLKVEKRGPFFTQLKRGLEAYGYKALLRLYYFGPYLVYLPILGRLFKRWFTLYALHQHGARVVSKEEAYIWIERAKEILSSICYCRETFKKCETSVSICLRISSTELFKAIDGEKARFISKDEAKDIIDKAEGRGDIHILAWCEYPYAYAICNCCRCCCIAYRVWSGFRIEAIEKGDMVREKRECKGCGRCIEVCRFGAIKKKGESIQFDQEHCYGCGVCRVVCETIRLIRR